MMKANPHPTFIERDCVIEHEGRSYEASGAIVSPECIVAYLGRDNVLTDWHGNSLGTYRVTSTWRTPRSYVSTTMSQVRAIVNGVTYTGRSAGQGMIYCGRRVADG